MKMTAEQHGPIYGVELIDALPLGGMMKQAMPSRADLDAVREISERTVAGYEVLLSHWRRTVLALAAAEVDRDEALQQIARSTRLREAIKWAASNLMFGDNKKFGELFPEFKEYVWTPYDRAE